MPTVRLGSQIRIADADRRLPWDEPSWNLGGDGHRVGRDFVPLGVDEHGDDDQRGREQEPADDERDAVAVQVGLELERGLPAAPGVCEDR